MIRSDRRLAAGLAALALTAAAGAAAGQTPVPAPGPVPPAKYQALGRALLEELIGIDSTHAHGSTAPARAIAARFLAAGFAPADVQVLVPDGHPDKGNVVVRLRGSGRIAAPLLYIGHLDVVEARREDWTYDPFKLTEADGWLYGRGTIDMKGQDAAVMTALIRLKDEGFVPDRDIIAAFTADEEAGGDFSGVDWLLKTHHDLVDAGLVINPDSGEAGVKHGRRLYLGIQTSEKAYVTFQLEARDKGGHSSRPTANNPIYRMARALGRIEAHPFPVRLTDTTRAYFKGRAELESGQVQADMREAAGGAPSPGAIERLSAVVETNIQLRTTCVTTMISGGQGESALPEQVKAVVQCRVLPGEKIDDVAAALIADVADPSIALTIYTPATSGPESPLDPKVTGAVAQVAKDMWPEVRILPLMSAGASDSAITRSAGMASYGVDAIFDDLDDGRAHGRDERIGVQAYREELEFTWRLMKVLADQP